ncbi:N,N-dimethylformamidase large subunit [Bradyrhizobium pachyrhizi]|uniref:N,N-dimethylformamidase large subunit n=1 Tax=Bradyrhizobium pachyrhizi TaxID=280333 RepID=A0A844SGI7_9BRAD|nr:N,N-dimethylformamidase beta subunit family domain-containing protein [Bradyrhizobium pachyrhizi]MVT64665.1 N,N-dimethylformamidase large subunit [Bradyrhizobium pachyrhizi]
MQPPIIGYCDPLRGRPGQRIAFHVSSGGGRPFSARVVRIACGDPNPQGPGLDIREVASDLGGQHPGQEQIVPIGSCGLAALPALRGHGALSAVFNVRPTRLNDDLRAILSLQDAEATQVVMVGLERGELVLLQRRDGQESRAATGLRLEAGQWYAVRVDLIDDSSAVAVRLEPIEARPLRPKGQGTVVSLAAPVDFQAWSRITFAAAWSGRPQHCFNGQIEQPQLRAKRDDNGRSEDEIVAAWDFSQRINQQTFPDVGPHGCDGTLVNVPTRAVRGSNWTGSEMNWRHAPQHYGAIHFHDDDLSDCKWAESLSLAISPEWDSGIYGLEVQNELGTDIIPFYVLPAKQAPRKPIAVLASTFTHMAYANHARGNFDEAFRARVRAWQAYPWNPDDVREFAASTYNYHSDGSGVSLSSRLRPILTMRPGFLTFNDPVGSGLRHFPADTHLVSWLNHHGFDFDIVTDEDLDDDGISAIEGYKVLVTGSHPEYHTERSLNALRDFCDLGGNFIYLGGNGFYWRIARRTDLPHVIEIRRAEGGIRAWACEPGEYYQQLDGGYGGLWRRNGRPPQALAGIGFAIQGPYEGSGYRRTAESYRPEVAWVFEGVDNDVCGNYGLFGGGAAGFELDQVSDALGTTPGTIVLARSEGHGGMFRIVPEEVLTHTLSLTADIKPEAHMVIGGGGDRGYFFSTGSITFIGSLCHNRHNNDVSRILANVVRRFSEMPTESK